jgi:hypothetical protein
MMNMRLFATLVVFFWLSNPHAAVTLPNATNPEPSSVKLKLSRGEHPRFPGTQSLGIMEIMLAHWLTRGELRVETQAYAFDGEILPEARATVNGDKLMLCYVVKPTPWLKNIPQPATVIVHEPVNLEFTVSYLETKHYDVEVKACDNAPAKNR